MVLIIPKMELVLSVIDRKAATFIPGTGIKLPILNKSRKNKVQSIFFLISGILMEFLKVSIICGYLRVFTGSLRESNRFPARGFYRLHRRLGKFMRIDCKRLLKLAAA